MESEDWEDTRAKFRRIAAQQGVRQIAKDVPASHTTIYRLISGDTAQPTHAVRAAIHRIVENHEEPER